MFLLAKKPCNFRVNLLALTCDLCGQCLLSLLVSGWSVGGQWVVTAVTVVSGWSLLSLWSVEYAPTQ